MPVLTDEHSRRVLFAGGQALLEEDFNTAQTLVHSQFLENLLASSIADAVDDGSSPTVNPDLESGENVAVVGFTPSDLIYVPFPGCGFVAPNGIANQLVTVGGPILQLVDEQFQATGETFPMFRLPSGQVLATAEGDATNPRIDLVEAKLEYVDDGSVLTHFEDAVTRAKSSQLMNRRRSVHCTVQVKQGAPAVAPVYPAPSPGFAAVAAIRVPANHNAAHSADDLRDLRFPLGSVRSYDVIPTSMWRPGATPWTLAHGSPALQAAAIGPASGSDALYAVCPIPTKTCRLVGIGIYQSNVNSAELVAIDHNAPSVPTITTLADLAGGSVSLVGAAGYRVVGLAGLADECGAAGAPAAHRGARATGTRIGTPMWCSGYPAGIGRRITATPETPHRQLAVRLVGATTDQLQFVRFFVAGGL